MKKNQGQITIIASLSLLAIIALLAIICITSYISAHNYGARTEALLEAKRQNSENVLTQYTGKVSEAAQVPAMYRDDLDKVSVDEIKGRYGNDGSQAVLQFIKEQNPTLQPAVYIQIQRIIEAGRDDFQRSQSEMIDVNRQYQASLNYFWRGFWLHYEGYPKIDLAKYNTVSSTQTNQIFNSHKDQVIKLR